MENSKFNLTRSPLPAANWSTFFKILKEAYDLHISTAGIPGQKQPVLVRDYPKTTLGAFDSQFDVILFRILSSVRAGTDPTGKLRIPKGPTTREVKAHPTKAGFHLVTTGWWENMVVEFMILAKSNDRADEITEWFHRFMMRYIFDIKFFPARGINYMVFEGRGEDVINKNFNQELNQRTLRYELRIEILTSFETPDLQSLHVTIEGNPQEEFDIEQKLVFNNRSV